MKASNTEAKIAGGTSGATDRYKFLLEAVKKRRVKSDALEEYLDMFLAEAEELYGPKVDPYQHQFLGIFFKPRRCAYVIPGTDDRGNKTVKVQLTSRSLCSSKSALIELAHESVHLLSPGHHDTMLEEGMACWHEQWWISKCPQAFPEWRVSPAFRYCIKKYNRALDLVTELLSYDASSVKRIREVQPVIGYITSELIQEMVPGIRKSLAKALVARWFKPSSVSKPEIDKRILAVENDSSFVVQDGSVSLNLVSTVGFYGWTKSKGLFQCDPNFKELFEGSPTLNITSVSESDRAHVFKRVDVSKLVNTKLRFTFFIAAKKVRFCGYLPFLNIWNDENRLVREFLAAAQALRGVWDRHDVSFTVPEGARIVELGVRLHKRGSLCFGSTGITSDKHSSKNLCDYLTYPAFPTNLKFVEPLESGAYPSGWMRSFGNTADCGFAPYKDVRIDSKMKFRGQNAVQFRCRSRKANLAPEDFCALLQRFDATQYRGVRIAFSGAWKCKDITSGCEVFIEAGEQIESPLRTSAQILEGSKRWARFLLQLDVPFGAKVIAIGARLFGGGQMHISDFQIECDTIAELDELLFSSSSGVISGGSDEGLGEWDGDLDLGFQDE